jgi:hypothetical protein
MRGKMRIVDVIVMAGLLAGPTWAAEHKLLKTSAGTTKLERSTLRDLRAGKVERLALADVVLERQKGKGKTRRDTATWVGKSKNGRSRLILTSGRDHVYGRMVKDGIVTLLVPGDEPFTTKVFRPDPAMQIMLTECEDAPPATLSAPPAEAADAAAEDDGTVIDVMIYYTDGYAAHYPGAQVQTRMQYLIDLANVSFTNSQINTQLRLVHSAQVSYPDDGTMSVALNAIRDNIGVFSNVENDRTTYGGDQVTLLRYLVTSSCGLASRLIYNSPRRAYAAVHDGIRADGAYCNDMTYTHEIGHNLSCSHNRAITGVSRFPYSYGYQSPAGTFHTMMSYQSGCTPLPCPWIDYFSNPNVTYAGEATGVASGSNSADNARTINFTRTEMANFRASVSGVTPTPTATPGEATATPTPAPIPPTATPTPTPTQTRTPIPVPPTATPTATPTPTPTPAPALSTSVTIPVMTYRSSDGGIYQIDCVYDGVSISILVNGIEVFNIATGSLDD